jgi:hypothetical protein
MVQKRLYEKDYYVIFYIPLLIGIVAGAVMYIYLKLQSFSMVEEGLESYSIAGIMSLSDMELFRYILKRRVCQLFLLLLMSGLISYAVLLVGYCGLFGCCYGLAFAQMFYQYGFEGCIYCVLCFFPHFICYGLVIYFIGKWFFCISKEQMLGIENVKRSQCFLKIFVIIFLFVFGMIWEIKFQKNILNYFYQYLV